VQALKESTGIEVGTLHWNGRGDTEDRIIEGCSMLPFCEQTLPEERTELGVAQPYSRQIRCGAAGTSGHFDADDSIFAAIAPGSLDAQFVESLEIVLIDGRYGAAFFCRLDECPERPEKFRLLIWHDYTSIRMASLHPLEQVYR
jgi:hypothetical protein